MNDYRALSVYAEVRGKYARPPPLLNKPLNEASTFFPQENKILSRPTTSGSLRRKSKLKDSVCKSFEEKTEKSDSPIKIRVSKSRSSSIRSASVEMSSNLRVNIRSIEKERAEDHKKKEKLEEHKEEIQDEIENNQETAEQEEAKSDVEEANIKDQPEDEKPEKESETTASSSKQKYIEELELLLRQEKLRRITAENELKRYSKSYKIN